MNLWMVSKQGRGRRLSFSIFLYSAGDLIRKRMHSYIHSLEYLLLFLVVHLEAITIGLHLTQNNFPRICLHLVCRSVPIPVPGHSFALWMALITSSRSSLDGTD